MIDETKKAILSYILNHPGVTPKVILRDVFENDKSKQRLLYRKLLNLTELGYTKTSLLFPENGASSPKLYFLAAKGAHIIGEKLPRDHGKFQRRDFRNMKMIRNYLS